MSERAPRAVRVLPGARKPLVDLAYGLNVLVATRPDGTLDLLASRTGGVLQTLPTRGFVAAIADEVGFAFVGDEAGRLRAFDLVTAEPGPWVGGLEGVRLLLPHPDGVRVALIAGDAMGVLNGETGRVEVLGDAAGAEALAWNADQTAPIALRLPGSHGDPRNGGRAARRHGDLVEAGASPALCVAHQPGTDVVAIGREDGSVELRDARGSRGAWVHHPGPVRAVRFTPAFLVTASADGTIAGWDVREAV